MKSSELKKNLIKYKGYQGQKSSESQKIEDIMMEGLADLLRVFKLDLMSETNLDLAILQDNLKYNNADIKHIKEMTRALTELQSMKEASNNYKIPEMILYILESAYDKYSMDNKSETFQNDDTKKVHFNMLKWKDVDTYLSILSPILDALEINFDRLQIKKKYYKQKYAYLIEKGIYSKEDLKNILKNNSKNLGTQKVQDRTKRKEDSNVDIENYDNER